MKKVKYYEPQRIKLNYAQACMALGKEVQKWDPMTHSTVDIVRSLLKALGFKEPNGN